MGDITKVVRGRSVTYSAVSVHADRWMTLRFGSHTVTFDTSMPEEQQRAIALEAEARTFTPPIEFDLL